MAACFAVASERNLCMYHSSSDSPRWILNGLLNRFIDNLLISLVVKAEWSWIFFS